MWKGILFIELTQLVITGNHLIGAKRCQQKGYMNIAYFSDINLNQLVFLKWVKQLKDNLDVILDQLNIALQVILKVVKSIG